MRRAALERFFAAQIAVAPRRDVLFSVHLKATMMKVSDPIIFGHAVRAYFADLFAEHGAALADAGVNPNNGLAALLHAVETLPDAGTGRDSNVDRPDYAPARRSRWSTPSAASPTSTSPAT